jgi:Rrf2 family protein
MNSRFAVAVHIVTLMAWARDEAVKSEMIARSVNTNPVVIRRIMCALARAGLVASQTGAAGGSRLARRPDEVTLLDVYRAVEGGQVFCLHPRPPSASCPVGGRIEDVLEKILWDVEMAVEEVLSNITVEQILRRIKAKKWGRGK